MSARQSTGNTVSKRTTAKHAKKSDRRDSEEEPAFVTGGAPRRWAPAETGEWESGSDSDDGPELLHRRHPFSQYADARNLSGISGIDAVRAIIKLTARKPSRRRLVNTYGLIQTENFVLVPVPATAPAQQSTPGLEQEREGPRKPRGYNTSPTGRRMQPAHLETSQGLDQQMDDTKMPAVTAERAAEASLFSHFIDAMHSLAPRAVPPMMPRSAPHPTPGHAYRRPAPYPSDRASASSYGLYTNSSSKKRSRASLSGEAMSNSQAPSIDKDMFEAPSHPVPAAGKPSRASAPTAKRSRSTHQSEEDLHRDQESFVVRIRKYTDQYGVPQLMMVQKGDPAPMEISSPEDEEGFTIGTKGAKTTRKDKGARRKRTILSVEPVLAMSNESGSDPCPTPAIAEPLAGSAEIGAQGTGVAGSLTQASACPAQPSGKASKGPAASSNSTSQDAQASIKGEPASACATTSSPPVAPSSASAPTGPALPPAPVNEDQDDAETKRVKRSLFKNGETASPGNASPSSGPSSGGLDLLLYAAFEHNSSTGAEAAKPNTEAHGKAPQGKAPVHRCITQAAKPAEALKCDEQVVFATDGHAKDDVAPANLPRQPSDQHAHADMLLLLAHTSPSSGPSSAGVLPPPLEADGPAGTQHRGPSSAPSSSSTSSPATQQMPSPPAPPAASPTEDPEPLPESDAPAAATSTSHKKKARWEWAGHYAAKRGRKRINRWPQAYQAYQFWAAQAMAANYGYYPYHHYYPQGEYGQPGYMPPPPPEGGYAYGQPYYPHPEAYHGHMPPGYEEEEEEEEEVEGEGKRKREGDEDEDEEEGGEEQEDASEEGHDAQMGKTPAGVTYHSAPQGGDFYDESEMDDMMRSMDEEDAIRKAAAKRAAKGAAKSAAKGAAKKGGKKKKKVRREA